MKRAHEESPAPESAIITDNKMKKIKTDKDEEQQPPPQDEDSFVDIDEDLLFEVLKYVDARTLGSAACVSQLWKKTAQDERLWEMICTRHWASKTGNSNQQLRSVVLALGGFRRLHSLCLWPLLKTPSPVVAAAAASSSSRSLPAAPAMPSHWGKDEVHLSLSLMSIKFYEKMSPMPRKKD
ncbi:hypothetical protein ACHQM5_025200 [Ranunculus cassubicifolius]